MTSPNRPVLIELEDAQDSPSPAEAPLIADAPQGAAMQRVMAVGAGRPSVLARWFWGLALSLVGMFASLAAWRFVTGLLASNPVLGWIAGGLLGAFVLVLLLIALRELAAFARLRRIDRLQHDAAQALETRDLTLARSVSKQLQRVYAARPETETGRDALTRALRDELDADGLLGVAEDQILAPLDAQACTEVEAAARQVATITALVPLALADVFAALTSNMRMIRRIAEIYGGRSGTMGTWRLTRTVFTHLIATGAVAVGDDLIGSVAGGGILSKLSRRFGEGVINGALTARVGVAAIEVCRPLPFTRRDRPAVTGLVRRALAGLFSSSKSDV